MLVENVSHSQEVLVVSGTVFSTQKHQYQNIFHVVKNTKTLHKNVSNNLQLKLLP